jgi:hypothetical protein
MSANLRHLPFSVHCSDADKPNLWVEIVYQLLSICSNVTMIIMIEAWMAENQRFSEEFPDVSEQETKGKNGVAWRKI